MAPTSQQCRQCNPSYVRTDEHRELMRGVVMGRVHDYPSASTRPEVARAIRDAWTPEKREEARIRGLLHASDRSWRDLIARSLMGDLNPNYQGKHNATPYGPGWGRRHRELIRERAGYQCEECGKRPSATLDVHHVDHSKDNHDPGNLVALCRACHKRVHPGG